MKRGDVNKWTNAWMHRARKVPLTTHSDDSDDDNVYDGNRGVVVHEKQSALGNYVVTLRRTRRAEEQVLKEQAITESLKHRLGNNYISDLRPATEHVSACRCDSCRMRRAKLRKYQETTERFKESSRVLSTFPSRETHASITPPPWGYTPLSFNRKLHSSADTKNQLGQRTSGAAGTEHRKPRYLSNSLWSHAAESHTEAEEEPVDYLASAFYDSMERQADYARSLFPGRALSGLARRAAAKKQEEAVRGLLRRMTVDTPVSGHSAAFDDSNDVRSRVRARSLSFSGAISPGNKDTKSSFLFTPNTPLNKAPIMPGSWQGQHGDKDSPSARRMRSMVMMHKLQPALKAVASIERSLASGSRTDHLSKGKPWTAYV
ncbi:hypothetical protein CEUSTIGMA_g9674.t1 [Chlamydomonas eustigma]|uniref:Uncharacterized protein n=1 Tax=Chlamydomonas eustigma TaxID=1157962 RepID=A0A250XGU5_9CHLO|nr:hypothetical protein CEUSTIGMA_g9674.t1 [Chlamydomonas eustigma]|eukprot:GAX82246.1 hypothetical protein CEUSTIGMA_g9674.t1 [Chlamydomonas eustigma]